jgi:Na+-driven multidrug efflux pump
MERGFDPEIKKYFKKILYSFSIGLLWLAANVTLGIYFKMADRNETPFFINLIFYAFLVISLFLLLRYYYKAWKK